MKSESGEHRDYISLKSFIKTLVLIGLFCVLCGSVFSLTKKYINVRRSIKHGKEAQIKLEEKKAKLQAETALLATPLGTEIALRDKYRLVKPNEGMVIITAPIQAPVEPKKSGIVRFWDMIVDIFD